MIRKGLKYFFIALLVIIIMCVIGIRNIHAKPDSFDYPYSTMDLQKEIHKICGDVA